jgi:hypothetical protein
MFVEWVSEDDNAQDWQHNQAVLISSSHSQVNVHRYMYIEPESQYVGRVGRQ